jgi:hypothetical protein
VGDAEVAKTMRECSSQRIGEVEEVNASRARGQAAGLVSLSALQQTREMAAMEPKKGQWLPESDMPMRERQRTARVRCTVQLSKEWSVRRRATSSSVPEATRARMSGSEAAAKAAKTENEWRAMAQVWRDESAEGLSVPALLVASARVAESRAITAITAGAGAAARGAWVRRERTCVVTFAGHGTEVDEGKVTERQMDEAAAGLIRSVRRRREEWSKRRSTIG